MIKVCHLTSVHPPFDIRIFYKQCISLKKNGYDISLIAPIDDFVVKEEINIIPIKLPKSRVKRMLVVNQRMLKLALKTKAKLFHFHDPELLLCGVLLKLFGKKVIFDVHENIRLSIKSKHWLPVYLVPIIQFIYFLTERFTLMFFDALVLAEESYLNYYPKSKSEVVLNYPIIKKQEPIANKFTNEILQFIYVGGVSENRGVWEMIELIQKLKQNDVNCLLTIVGNIYSKNLEKEINNYISINNLDANINLKGLVDFKDVERYLQESNVGIALLRPIANYKESLPTKIFEYMQNGLPLITNNFPLYKQYVDENNVGICIDIDNIEEEFESIYKLINNIPLMVEMGKNGIEIINNKYNWKSEEVKLLKFYQKILN